MKILKKIELDEGKYTLIQYDDYSMECLRHDAPWRDLSGDNMVYHLLNLIDPKHLSTEKIAAVELKQNSGRAVVIPVDDLLKLEEARKEFCRTLNKDVVVSFKVTQAMWELTHKKYKPVEEE